MVSLRKRLSVQMHRRLSLQPWVPRLLLLFGCQLSLGAAWFVTSTEQAQARTRFQADARDTARQIQTGLDAYLELVRAGTALLAVSNEVNHVEFRAFVASLQLRERYPGIEAIGFSQRVNRRDLRSFVRRIELDGITRFRVWPAGARPEYHPILFFEPRAKAGQTVVGFDMWTDSAQREAMEHARDTGQPMASGRLRDAAPFQEVTPPDLALFIPVYRVKGPMQSVEQRRRALVGFVFGTFKLHDLLPRIVEATTRSVAFEIYDGKVGDPAALLYRSAEVGHPARFGLMEVAHVPGRNWSIALRSTDAPARFMSPAAWRTLLVGLLLSLLVFLITRGQVRAWETAARHEAELRASERALRESESELQQTVGRERSARAQAEAAGRAKDEFLATLSHELRTPLNTVLGWLTLLRTGSLREDQHTHALEVIDRNARLQAHLIEDLLDVSRIVMGKVQLTLRPLAVSPVVSTVIESLRPTADAKGLTLHPPAVRETAVILGDASRVQQILWNLLSNAIKFTPAGGHVSVELTEDHHHVQLCVRDTGVGIAPDFLPHVFERFRQADSSTTRAHYGVGLGLAIVQDLVELHGGTIEALSEGLNRGAMFVVRIPSALPSTLVSPGPVDAVASAALADVRVLVVDDDAETRELLSQALTDRGAHVTTAESARQAFEQLGTEGADVLVSDIGMSEEDGFSLMRRIRSMPGAPSRIPAIALTAYARPDDRARALEAGYQLHFVKPVELADLQAGLATLIGPHAKDTRPHDQAAGLMKQ